MTSLSAGTHAVVPAGETVTAGVLIPERAFQHWTGDGWSTEPGSFVLSAGPSSASLPLTATIGRLRSREGRNTDRF